MTDPDGLKALFELETFESGGRELWDGMQDARDPTDVVALVVEVCRVKDRLDRLHRLASRDDNEWGRISPHRDSDTEFVLEIGNVLREQRQTEVVFKQLVAEVNRRREAYDYDDDDDSGGLSDL
ncbi:terminase small subunit [Corynebacterium phage CL31]|nr:terminase small subunit [Corynebacterium phage CL31]